MDFSPYFLLPDGRLRAGWRLVLFLALFALALVVFNGLASTFFREPSLVAQAAILAATTVSATWLLMRFLEHQPFQAVGLALQRESSREMGSGFVGGVFLAGMVTGVEWATGLVSFQASGVSSLSTAISIFSITALLGVSATTEELLFRGYPFQRLLEGTNGRMAILISALVFGWVHASNPHASSFSVLNTVLAGVLLSLCYLRTRALWLPIGFHFSWNWTLSLVGLPVSGMRLLDISWQAVASSQLTWLHGGDYGPEGGLIATAALALGIIYMSSKPQKAPSSGETPSSPTTVETEAA